MALDPFFIAPHPCATGTGAFRSRFLDLPDGRVHYLEGPAAGARLHFLHANGFCGGTYAPFLGLLGETFHITASDIRGHGDTQLPLPQPVTDWSLFADDLRRTLEALDAPPVIAVGHSLGAVTTYLAAATWPRLFRAIVMIEPPIFDSGRLLLIGMLKKLGMTGRIPLVRGARRRRRRFLDRQEALGRFAAGRGIFHSWRSEFIAAYLACGLRDGTRQDAELKCDPESEAQIFESIPLDVWRYAPRIRCPALLLRGCASDTLLPAAARRLERSVAGLHRVDIPGAGHFAPMEQPEACTREIKRFLQECAP
jgi:pimeloyl-ACP methyl ester carboxylesterase